MTTYSKTTLKTFFEQGDVPSGTNYADLIDSQVNLAETSNQSMAGPLTTTELIAAQVSAGNLNVTGTLSAASFSINTISVSAVDATRVSAALVNSTGNITASAGTVYASAVRTVEGMYGTVTIISAAGTTQATAAPLTAFINRGAGVVDGSTTGFALPANRVGYVQYIINGGASANLWPPTGGQINALASNAAFGMAANIQYTILHTLASGYSVK